MTKHEAEQEIERMEAQGYRVTGGKVKDGYHVTVLKKKSEVTTVRYSVKS
jgi:hypothetical protein